MSAPLGLWNGEALPLGEAQLPAGGDAAQYGLGCFTTICVRRGRMEAEDLHAARLARDAIALGLPAPDPGRLAARGMRVIELNRIGWGALRVSLFAAGSGADEWIQPRDNPYPENGYIDTRRLRVQSCTARRGRPLSGIKSLNYAEHLLAQRAARAAGFDDALWVDDRGAVLETATANVFAVVDGRCVTPPLAEGILPGVFRHRLLAALPDIVEAPLTRADLAQASEVFVTNSLGGVMGVGIIDDGAYGVGPWVHRARAAVTSV